jgi:hypothetical protein
MSKQRLFAKYVGWALAMQEGMTTMTTAAGIQYLAITVLTDSNDLGQTTSVKNLEASSSDLQSVSTKIHSQYLIAIIVPK